MSIPFFDLYILLLRAIITVLNRHYPSALVQTRLTRLNGSVVDSSVVATSKVTPDREILIEPRNHLLRTRSVAPIPHQVTSNREQADSVHTSLGHTVIRHIPNKRRRSSGRLNIRPNRIPLLPQRQRQERGAHIRRDARHDNLRLVGGSDSVTELLVIPGIDFALALHEGRVGEHLEDLLGQGTVGTGVGGGGQDDGEVEDFAEGGVGEHLVAVEGWVEVAGKGVETDLEVDDEEKLSAVSYGGSGCTWI